MKTLGSILIILIILFSCSSTNTTVKTDVESSAAVNDTIRIANEELEYEIIILEVGFTNWLATQPPMGHYGLTYLENRNRRFVLEYNNRVYQDRTRQLYEQEINYDQTIRYGLEVNFLLYNYFVFFQKKYNQKL